MKVAFLLFVLISDVQGNEQLLAISEKKHQSLLSCYAEKARYQNIENRLTFFCANEKKFLKVSK